MSDQGFRYDSENETKHTNKNHPLVSPECLSVSLDVFACLKQVLCRERYFEGRETDEDTNDRFL